MNDSYRHTVSCSRDFNMDRPTLFAVSQDMELRPLWDAQVKALGFMQGSTRLEKGATVFVEDIQGGRTETRYLVYDVPHKIAVMQTNTSPYFSTFQGSWVYESISGNTTKLKMTYNFDLKFPYRLVPALVKHKIRQKLNEKLSALHIFLLKENIASGLA